MLPTADGAILRLAVFPVHTIYFLASGALTDYAFVLEGLTHFFIFFGHFGLLFLPSPERLGRYFRMLRPALIGSAHSPDERQGAP